MELKQIYSYSVFLIILVSLLAFSNFEQSPTGYAAKSSPSADAFASKINNPNPYNQKQLSPLKTKSLSRIPFSSATPSYSCPNTKGIVNLKNGKAEQVWINPHHRNIIFVKMADMSVYRSLDYGSTFESIGTYNLIEFDKLDPDKVFASYGSYLFSSSDGGKKFVSVANFYGEVIDSLYADRFKTNKVYAGVFPAENMLYRLYIFENGATTFKDISFSFGSDQQKYSQRRTWDIDQDPQNSNIIYIISEDFDHTDYEGAYVGGVAANYLILRSTNGGENFESVTNGINWHGTDIIPFIDTTKKTQWIFNMEMPVTYILDQEKNKWVYYNAGKGIDMVGYKIKPDNYYVHFAVVPVDKNEPFHYVTRIMKNTGSEIIASSNAGKDWKMLIDLPGYKKVTHFDFDDCGNIYFTDLEQGLFRVNYKN